MKSVSGADVEVIFIASGILIAIALGIWSELSSIKTRLDKIIEILQERP
jgi:hypothetical protein